MHCDSNFRLKCGNYRHFFTDYRHLRRDLPVKETVKQHGYPSDTDIHRHSDDNYKLKQGLPLDNNGILPIATAKC